MTDAKRILVIGYGNPGRQDDGLGPELVDRLIARMHKLPSSICFQSNYQLTVEDAYDLQDYAMVVFVDALAAENTSDKNVEGDAPFFFNHIEANGEQPMGSHSLLPESVLQLCQTLYEHNPKAFVLGIRGYEFDAFEECLTPKAKENCDLATRFLSDWLEQNASESSHA